VEKAKLNKIDKVNWLTWGPTNASLLTNIGSFLVKATSMGVVAGGVLAEKALADPPPAPPPNTVLPPVFCFRFTDTKAVEDDPEGDKFQVTFEVLNWTDTPVGGVRIALNTGNNSFAQDAAPTFAGAGLDGNGPPLGPDADPLPGNNTGSLVESTSTAVQWTAGQFDFNTFTNIPVPNRDLLGVPSLGGTAACAMVPGCVLQGNNSIVNDWETVDNGNNVVDGFTITVDDLDELEAISWNWLLLDENGDPIGTPGCGNAMGFGTVNLACTPINEESDPDATFSIFPGNTGASQSSRVFADNAHRVTEYGPPGFDTLIPAGGTAAAATFSVLNSNSSSGGGGDVLYSLRSLESSAPGSWLPS